MPYVIAIAGPTAIGKSKVAVELAKLISAEIVSVDVMQSYREMDIGTAKIMDDECDEIKHYMISEFDIDENVNISQYTERAISYINEILSREKNVILVGGSGLYLDSILYASYHYHEEQIDHEYREYLYNLASLPDGKSQLYGQLKEIDPEYANITHQNNIKRVIRALEYYHASKKKKSSQSFEKTARFEKTIYFGLELDRKILYHRINARVDQMIQVGLSEEVHELMNKGYEQSLNAMKAIGYQEFLQAFRGDITTEEAIDKIKQHSRNYAKRQYTWFRRNSDIIWFDVAQYKNLFDIAVEMEKRIFHE